MDDYSVDRLSKHCEMQRPICRFSRSDIIGQSISLWNLVHHMTLGYKRKHTDWHVVRHENLSRDPIAECQNLYTRLGLAYSKKIEREALRHSSTRKPAALKRDSKASISSWKVRLTPTEINRFGEGTRELAKNSTMTKVGPGGQLKTG